jgi:uncharacterized membrane protein
MGGLAARLFAVFSVSESNLFTLDPAWPWSSGGLGLEVFICVGLVLVGLTFWTYSGTRGASRKRIQILIALRLAALAVACLAVLRPSVAVHDELRVPSTVLLAIDHSESMQVQDQHKNQSRWEYLQRLVAECRPQIDELRDKHNIVVIPYRFAGDVAEYDANGKADGKRTDFGEMLNALYERHGNERFLRTLVVLSDGADNGTRYPAAALAAKWRMLPCPIHTFAFGQTTTSSTQHDVALTSITPEPSPVPTKAKLTVRSMIDAPGFENSTARLHLFIGDKEVLAQDAKLPQTTGNEVRMVCDAPPDPGEVKVTLKVDPLPGEVTQANNQVSTYLTVTREGISVLYVEGKYRAWEPKFIRYALSRDPSIRLFEAVRLTDEPPPEGEADLFQFEKQHYDVIIIGDVTARRLSANNPAVLDAIRKQVYEHGAGLMMMGGYESFGNSDWGNTPIATLLPVELDASGQIEGAVQMVPTFNGLRHYVMRLAENQRDNEAVWAKLPKLDGMTHLGRPKPQSFVLARSADEPILVGQLQYGAGRTLAFAGDTTWRWCSTPEGLRAHNQFWRRLVLWLAKRDEAEGNVVIMPDTRRLAAGGKLSFAVKLRGKGGVEIPEKDAHFEVTAIGPEQRETKVATARQHGEERGTFWKTDVPGEYSLVARAWGTDVDGKPLDNLPPARIRFIVYQDDSELSRQAADHDFLNKLASAGGGKFHQADELRQFLRDVPNQPLAQNRTKAKLWPDWRRGPASHSTGDQIAALTQSGMLVIFILFVSLVGTEWLLRRLWGFV